jgi:hypothetical protein
LPVVVQGEVDQAEMVVVVVRGVIAQTTHRLVLFQPPNNQVVVRLLNLR